MIDCENLSSEDLERLTKTWQANELYQKSLALYKQYQGMYLTSRDDTPLTGSTQKMETINGEPVLVLLHFDDKGFFHSEGDEPAVEYPLHWEYWNHGLITKVVDHNTTEIWNEGVPVEIKRGK